MYTGKNVRKNLALYVALAVSAGGTYVCAPLVEAAHTVTIASTDTAHGGGVDGTAETGSGSHNEVTIGDAGAGSLPVITGDVYGAHVASGNPENNKLVIRSILLTGNVYGGYTPAGYATWNEVTLSGGTISGDVYASSANLPTPDTIFSRSNTVTIDAAASAPVTVGGTIYVDNHNTEDGNSLVVKGKAVAGNIRNFGKLKFFVGAVPAGDTMLTLTDGVPTGNLKVRDMEFDTSALAAPSDSPYAETKYTLMRNDAGLNVDAGHEWGMEYFDATARLIHHTATYEYVLTTANRTANDTTLTVYGYHYKNHTAADFTAADTAELAWGGRSLSQRDVTGNKLKVTGGTIANAAHTGAVYGGLAENFTNNPLISSADADENTLTLTGGTIDNAYGGRTRVANSAAKLNTLTLDGAAVRTLTGGMGEKAEENKVYVKSGALTGGATGGEATNGAARKNEVHVESAVTGDVRGGVASGDAWGNKALIRADVAGNVYGGHAGADAEANEVALSGGMVTGDVYAGFATGTGVTRDNLVTADAPAAAPALVTGTIYGGNKGAAGNTLAVKGGLTAGNIKNFDTVKFVLGHAGETMLRLTDGSETALDWENGLAFDTSHASASATGISTWTLLDSANAVTFDHYDRAKNITDTLEYVIDKSADGKKIIAKGYQHSHNDGGRVSSGTYLRAWGGLSESGHDVEKNSLSVDGTAIVENAYGGLSHDASHQPAGKAADNTAVVSENAVVTNLTGGYAATATGNTAAVEGGTITGAVIGGRAAAGAATKNIAVLKAGCTLGTSAQPITITGGLAENGAASGNTIDVMSGAVIHGNLIGGDGTTATNDNTVILENATVNGTIIGGTRPNAAGNTLIVDGGGTTAKQFSNLQSLQFIIPESMTAAQAAANPLLQLTSTTQDITGMKIGVQVAGNASPLQKGDEVSLMKVAAGGTITSAAHLQNEVTVKQGVARRYKFSLQKTAANDEIRATVDGISVSEKSKSLVETRAAASALINSSADLLTDAGFAAAGAVAAQAGGSFDAWAVQTGSSMRLHSGSYIDTKGYGLNVGFVRKNALKDGALTFGPFVEYGRGSYDSYLDDGTHGDGTISYIGAGLMAKLSQTSGGYIEGSLRAGRAKSDYKGMLDGDVSNYDSANAYYAAHLGFGHVFKLRHGDLLDGYVKGFYTRQNGTDETVYTNGSPEKAHFDAVTSKRLRLGARYTHKDAQANEMYAGLAWEFEFGGKASAIFGEDAAPSPSLRGGSALLELGYRFAPKNSRVSYGLNLAGWQGKREGISGGLNIAWGF